MFTFSKQIMTIINFDGIEYFPSHNQNGPVCYNHEIMELTGKVFMITPEYPQPTIKSNG